jgi:hypothetical protein
MKWIFTVPNDVSEDEVRDMVEKSGGIFQEYQDPIPYGQAKKSYFFRGSGDAAIALKALNEEFLIHPIYFRDFQANG